MKDYKWETIRDGLNNEDPDCMWATRADSEKYGRYIWISDIGDGFEITSSTYTNHIITCKSLKSAKRWVTMNVR